MNAAVWGTGVGAAVVLAATAAAGVGYLLRQAYRLIRAGFAFFQRLDKALVNVESQLYPNGGESLRDAVNRLQDAAGVQDIPSSKELP